MPSWPQSASRSAATRPCTSPCQCRQPAQPSLPHPHVLTQVSTGLSPTWYTPSDGGVVHHTVGTCPTGSPNLSWYCQPRALQGGWPVGGCLCCRPRCWGTGPTPAGGTLLRDWALVERQTYVPSAGPTHRMDVGRAVRSLCPAPSSGCSVRGYRGGPIFVGVWIWMRQAHSLSLTGLGPTFQATLWPQTGLRG